MFTEKDLRELSEFSASEPVLTLYLNTDPTEGNADAYRLRLRNMLKDVNLPDDLLVLERYFKSEYDWSGRGVAVFSCAPKGFFRAYPLGIPVRNMIQAGSRPSLRLMNDLMDSYGGYGVALVDKQGARLFLFHLGELIEQEGVLGEEVRRTKHGGASSMPGARSRAAGHAGKHIEEVVDRNMKETAAYAVEFFESHHVRRVLIGGTEENVKQFRSYLPKSWQSLVVTTFPMSINASHAEVTAKLLEICASADGKREQHLIKDLLESAEKGSRAVVGIEPTLQAANEGRITTLVMTDAFRHPAFMCAECGRMTVLPGQVCTVCGGKFYDIDDVRDTLVRSVMKSGGDVEVVKPQPAQSIPENIGAFVRF